MPGVTLQPKAGPAQEFGQVRVDSGPVVIPELASRLVGGRAGQAVLISRAAWPASGRPAAASGGEQRVRGQQVLNPGVEIPVIPTMAAAGTGSGHDLIWGSRSWLSRADGELAEFPQHQERDRGHQRPRELAQVELGCSEQAVEDVDLGRSPSGSKLTGLRSRAAAAITRRPSRSIRSACARARSFRSASHGMVLSADRAVAARAITAGAAPLTKHRTTGRPAASVAKLKVAISL